MRTLFHIIPILFLISISACAPKEKAEDLTPQLITIDSLTVFMDFDRHELVMPGDIIVTEEGNIIVAELQRKKIIITDADGNKITEFGQEGKGPAEFLYASQIHINSGNISIIDQSQKKVLNFDKEGNFIGTYLYKSYGMGADAISLTGSRDYFSTAGGRNNSLIIRANTETDSVEYFGIAKGNEVDGISLDESRKNILNGEVPDFLKNMATIHNDGESIYVFLESYSELQKYDMNGSLIWEKHIDLPDNVLLEKDIMEIVKQGPPNRLPYLRYSYDINLKDDAIYILGGKAADKPQHLVKLNSDGQIEAIYQFNDPDFYVSKFAVNPNSGTLYLSSIDGFVYKTALSE